MSFLESGEEKCILIIDDLFSLSVELDTSAQILLPFLFSAIENVRETFHNRKVE